MIYCSK